MHSFNVGFWSGWLFLVEVEKGILIQYLITVTISIIEKPMLNQFSIDVVFSTLNLPTLI